MTLGELDSPRHGYGIPVGIDLRDRRLELLGDRRWKLLPRELELLEDQDLRRADAKVQKLAERNRADGAYSPKGPPTIPRQVRDVIAACQGSFPALLSVSCSECSWPGWGRVKIASTKEVPRCSSYPIDTASR